MSKRKYVLAGSLGVIGALLVSGTASGAVTGFTYSDTISPKKQSAKTFGPAALHNSLDTFYTQGGGFAPTPTTTVVQFSKDIKFTAGNLPQCNLNSISTVPDTTAMSMCGASKLGTGSVLVNGGVLTGKVTAYNGVPSGGGEPPIGFHTDLFLASGVYSFSTTGIGTLDPKTNTLTTPIPPTGTSLTHFEVAIGKVKSGKKKGKPTYYVMARCKKKKWTDVATESFSDGSSRSATSVQKCKAKKK
ncbi:MAG: hypothetical protein WBZ00_07615 [Solirubrobacterales bacterium]